MTIAQFLPDGKHFLYFADSAAKPENNAIFVGSLDSKERKLILNANSNPVYVSPGYLLFNRQGTLMAQPFDADRLQLSGERRSNRGRCSVQTSSAAPRVFLLPTMACSPIGAELQRFRRPSHG